MEMESVYAGLVLSFQVPGEYKPTLNVPIDKIGSNVILLKSADESNSKRKILYDVRYRSASKVVVFRSPVLVQNRTEVAVEIRFGEEKGEREGILVESYGSIPVPVDHTDNCVLSFRPAGFNFDWCRPILLRQSSKGIVKCTTSGETHQKINECSFPC